MVVGRVLARVASAVHEDHHRPRLATRRLEQPHLVLPVPILVSRTRGAAGSEVDPPQPADSSGGTEQRQVFSS